MEDIPPFPDFAEFQTGYPECIGRFQKSVSHLTSPPCPTPNSPSPLPLIPLELLDLLGIRRASYNQSLIRQLCVCMRKEVTSADPVLLQEVMQRLKLEELIRMPMPELSSCLFDLMLHMESVDEVYLRILASEPDFLEKCPLPLKQLVWELEEHKSLFSDSVSPLLDEYIEAKERILNSSLGMVGGSVGQTFFTLPLDIRRSNREVHKLLELVGGSYKLYNTLSVFIRILFSKTRKPHFCTLRCDLVTSLQRTDSPSAVRLLEQESCSHFISLLDQAQGEPRQRAARLVEIHQQFRAVKKYMSDSYETLFDLVMALRDPHTVHMLCRITLEHASKLAIKRKLPRQSNEVLLTLHLLNIALQALSIIDKRIAPEPALDHRMLSQFIPDLMLFMTQEKISFSSSSIVPVLRLGQISETGPPQAFPFSAGTLRLLECDPVANSLFCFLVIQVTKKRDLFALLKLLPVYADHHNLELLPELFFHEFSTYLVPVLSQVSHCDLQDVHAIVFVRFWLVFYTEEDAFRHACRLIRALCEDMPSERLINLLEEMGRVDLSTEKMTDEWSDTIHFISEHSSVPLSFFTDGTEEYPPVENQLGQESGEDLGEDTRNEGELEYEDSDSNFRSEHDLTDTTADLSTKEP
ncbi:Negative elongation factor B-like [Oopsacas minuta]|uniref:Negative elongation factor B-like n=1 Tax=Oopsacas minuta TaxID=111878 RepID=A0AAV7JCN2_9METZ|nr:Negative elongation factor B-like [Oopsacas minuta]